MLTIYTVLAINLIGKIVTNLLPNLKLLTLILLHTIFRQ